MVRMEGGTDRVDQELWAELAAAYVRADDWSREVVAEEAPAPGWPRTLAFVAAAAFHEYSRGAQDYLP